MTWRTSLWYDVNRASAIAAWSSRFANSMLGKFDATIMWRAWESECFSVFATGVSFLQCRAMFVKLFSAHRGHCATGLCA